MLTICGPLMLPSSGTVMRPTEGPPQRTATPAAIATRDAEMVSSAPVSVSLSDARMLVNKTVPAAVLKHRSTANGQSRCGPNAVQALARALVSSAPMRKGLRP